MNPFVSAVRHLFFTGKGGVGKTALSCATAISLAAQGRRVLLVSTDPASNLDEMLETKLSNKPTAIAGASGLAALNLDPGHAADAYRERIIGPYVATKISDELRTMREQLSGACTTEIAAGDHGLVMVMGKGGVGKTTIAAATLGRRRANRGGAPPRVARRRRRGRVARSG